jgi:hypothetical protein
MPSVEEFATLERVSNKIGGDLICYMERCAPKRSS